MDKNQTILILTNLIENIVVGNIEPISVEVTNEDDGVIIKFNGTPEVCIYDDE